MASENNTTPTPMPTHAQTGGGSDMAPTPPNGSSGKENNPINVGTGVPVSKASSASGGAATMSLENGPMAKNGRRGSKSTGMGRGNRFMQQHLPENSARGSQSQSLGNSGNSSRNFKDMVEVMKKLHGEADKLQERVARVHCGYAESIMRGALLFDPSTVHILNNDHPEVGGLPDPDKVHFTRQSVDDAYIELSQIVTTRPMPEPAELGV